MEGTHLLRVSLWNYWIFRSVDLETKCQTMIWDVKLLVAGQGWLSPHRSSGTPPLSGRHVPRHVSSNWGLAVQLELPSTQSEALCWLHTEIWYLSVLYIYCNWCKMLHVCTLTTLMTSYWARRIQNHYVSLCWPAGHVFSTLSHLLSQRKGVCLQAISNSFNNLFKQRTKCIKRL